MDLAALKLQRVHNNIQLTNSQKFHYLKGCLRDEAASLLRHISISDANYLQAWDKLIKRYEKKGLIVKSFVKTFLSLPSITSLSATGLRRLTDGADEVIRGLAAIDAKAEERDPWLIHILLNKLDPVIRQTWAEETTSSEFPTFTQLIKFLETKCQALEDAQSTSRHSQQPKLVKSNQHTFRSLHTSSAEQCPKCEINHLLFQCPTFQSMDISSRRKFVNEQRLCFNCLRSGHMSSNCKSQRTCQKCKRKHHTLVHNDSKSNQFQNNNSPSESNVSSHTVVSTHSTPYTVTHFASLLPTAVGCIADAYGNTHDCRILLDSGSQVSFISESFVKRLRLPRQNARISILGLSSINAGTTKGVVHIKLQSRNNNRNIAVSTFILPNLTSLIPNSEFDIQSPQLSTIRLADPNFNKPGNIDVLLGADKVFHVLGKTQFDIANTPLIAHQTIFGWIIAGSVPTQSSTTFNAFSTFIIEPSLTDIDKTLNKFWEVENINQCLTSKLTELEEKAEHHFCETTQRSADGHYIVQLPFRNQPIVLENAFQQALNRLHSMEQRFKRNTHLYIEYKKFIQEYLNLGHMEKVPVEEINNNNTYYLPHHAVIKPDSSTTRLRVVFDGSSKSSSGNSLNDILLIGPPVQRELFSVSLRFRLHPYVFTSDISKMYRQIWIAPQHADYRRILWRDSPNDIITHFRLKTVTYGISSAPFLAVRTLEQLATDYKSIFPNASSILMNDCYVDDIITGTQTVDELLKLKEELINLLKQGGFTLHKWSSNCWPLLSSCSESECELSAVDFSNETKFVKTLGLHWYPSADEFFFKVSLQSRDTLTKRNLLSDASKIFDPLGFLTPITVAIKILFQDLWLLNLSWDEPIPAPIAAKWNQLRDELSMLNQIRICRWLGTFSDVIEIHGFSDASEKAYAAVVYCRTIKNNKVNVQFIAAKSKVAPLKQISLPRLELCGALLLSRLLKQICHALHWTSPTLFCWTDSKIVLNWLSSMPRRWNTFVANRTSEILELTSRSCWRHVTLLDNPADPASRGLLPSQLLDNNIWFTGLTWLYDINSTWPTQNISTTEDTLNLEERTVSIKTYTAESVESVLTLLITKYSEWIKLLRIIAFCFRFYHNMSSKIKFNINPRTGYLTTNELFEAKWLCIKFVQKEAFSAEIKLLNQNKDLNSNSKIITLSPFLDVNGILRVGGRLKYSDLPYRTKHPILLPKGHTLCQLIIKHYHLKYLHCGLSSLTSLIRQEYWILNCRNMIKQVIHICISCFRHKHNTTSQIMSDLPQPRVVFKRPFLHVGVDYAGPITLRLSRGRKPKYVKGYISLFICLASKAVHLELVGDLTSEAFIAALRRFFARRGKCSTLYSDNGTNFKGAHRKLSEMYQLLSSQTHHSAIQNMLSQEEIHWSFNPPSAPHVGGLWEAGVKSVKSHLNRVLRTTILTFEEMNTLLTQIEAVLNSRPLCALSDNEADVLTPFHLLTGQGYSSIPESSYEQLPSSQLSNWELLQNLVQGFWKRWRSDYLTSLQPRSKWHKSQPNLQIGDLVLIKDSTLPPAKWGIARILHVHPGPDGIVRVVTLKTKFGELTRPIVKLIKLPIEA